MSTKSELHPVTALRRRMIADLQLRGLSERTQEMYVRAVRQLAEHYGKPPDQTTEEELCEYFLHIKNVKKWSRAGMTIALCGIKFFYAHTLQRQWTSLTFIRPPKDKRLPTVLSRDEVQCLLHQVRLQRYRVCLHTIYSCGLRLGEALNLQVRDADSARLVLHIRHATGGKDRDCAAAAKHTRMATPVLENASSPRMDVSGAWARRHAWRHGHRTDVTRPRARRLWRRLAREWHAHTRVRAYAAPLRCPAAVGSRRQPTPASSVPWPWLADHHRRLYPPDHWRPRSSRARAPAAHG